MYKKNQIKLSVFADMINVHPKTLQRYDRESKIIAYRTDTGRRYYTIEQFELFKRGNRE